MPKKTGILHAQNITKRQLMTTIPLIFVIIISSSVGLAPVAVAANPWDPGEPNPDPTHISVISSSSIEVTPTDSYPTDPNNVQWAVNNVDSGGTVLLKEGTFNFGDDPENEMWNFVGIYNHNHDPQHHITITGDGTNANEDPKTIIKNGLAPIRVYSSPNEAGPTDPETELKTAYPIYVTIQDLWFDTPHLTAIALFTGGATITGNKITDVHAIELPGPPPKLVWDWSFGIQASGIACDATYLSGYPSLDENPAPGYPIHISINSLVYLSEFGDMTIHDNVLEGAYGDIVKGLFISDIKEAVTVTVSHNTISQLTTTGEYETGPYLMDIRGFEHPDSVRRIKYNTVSSPLADTPFGVNHLEGIDVSAHHLGSSGIAYINHNTIISEENSDDDPVAFWSHAIFFRGKPDELTGEIKGNTITGDWGIGLLLKIVEHCLVKDNDLSDCVTSSSQLKIELQAGLPESHHNRIMFNTFGRAGEAAIHVEGDKNHFIKNVHTQSDPGWPTHPLWLFSPESEKNKVITPVLDYIPEVPQDVIRDLYWEDYGAKNKLLLS